MSNHKVEIVPVKLIPHQDADSLSIVNVFGWTVCVRTEDWKGRTIGAYIPPDSIVDSSRPEFTFLKGHERIKVKKLRGVISQGLLIPAPEGAEIGDDVMERLGIKHYEPPLNCTTGGQSAPAPAGYHPHYDIERAQRYLHLFTEGELVWITEKIHGANGRFCFDGEKMYCGSRTEWKVERDDVLWWQALKRCPWLEYFCRTHPNITVYGEVFGEVQDLNYGRSLDVMVFDLLENNRWVEPREARVIGNNLQWVPKIGEIPFNFDDLKYYAEGQSKVNGASHIREGIVVKPIKERTDHEIGRVQVKIVGNGYLMR